MSPAAAAAAAAAVAGTSTTFAQARRTYTIRCTLKKMLQRRGYEVPQSLLDETEASFEAQWLSACTEGALPDLSFSVHRPRERSADTTDANMDMDGGDQETELLMVFFPQDTTGAGSNANLGIAPIREYIEQMDEKGCSSAILVVSEGLTAPAVGMLRELELKNYFITAFPEIELLVDIYEHHKVPRHVRLTATERAQLSRDLKVTEDLLPKMQRHDPMARYLGLRVGDVVKIFRYSMTVAHDVYYRVVVDSEDFD
jgi:DNA-directed RNA polymerase I, II, and III subunit RPABC1